MTKPTPTQSWAAHWENLCNSQHARHMADVARKANVTGPIYVSGASDVLKDAKIEGTTLDDR